MFFRFLANLLFGLLLIDVACATTSLDEKMVLDMKVRQMIADDDYPSFLKIYDTSVATKKRYADGVWQSALLLNRSQIPLEPKVYSEENLHHTLSILKKISDTTPSAWLLYAKSLQVRAWQLRGTGYASSVKPDAMKAFTALITESSTVLEEQKSKLQANPDWHMLRLQLAIEKPDGDEKSRVLFEEAAAKFPDYHEIFFARMRHLSPLWHGSRKDMLQLINDAPSMNPASKREGIYVRLLWNALSNDPSLIYEADITKADLQNSMEMILDRYPDEWNLQKFLMMSCQKSNLEYARALLEKIKQPPIKALLENDLSTFGLCKDWASGKLDGFIIREHTKEGMKQFYIH